MKFASPLFGRLGRWATVTLLLGILAGSASAASVTVTWAPNPETDIAGYKVHYGISSGTYTNSIDVGNLTSTVIPGLAAGQAYYFAAKAYNEGGLESAFSSEVSITIPLTNSPPEISGLTQLAAQKETTTSLSSLDINDPDNPNEIMQVNLGVGRGRLDVSAVVPGGVTANQVLGNSSRNLQVSAPLSAIRTTFANPGGLTYTGDPNLVGADTLQVAVADSGNGGAGAPRSANRSIPITVTGDAIDAWRNQIFAAADLVDPTKEATLYGDNADPEGDGVDNLMEFALGLDPLDAGGLDATVQVQVITVGGGNNHATLRVRRRINSPGIGYIPEVSGDQVNWSSQPAEVEETSVDAIDSDFELVTYQDLTPVVPAAPRFLRLRVERTSL